MHLIMFCLYPEIKRIIMQNCTIADEQVCLICLYDFFYFIYEELFDKLFQNMLFNRLVSTFVFVYTCILANLCCTISLMFLSY